MTEHSPLTPRVVEEKALHAKLFYNNATKQATSLYEREKRNVFLTRLSLGFAVLCGAVSGVCFYYQSSSIHRVWRLRHSVTVKRITLLNYVCLANAVTIALFLFSPIGFPQLNRDLQRQNKDLDDLAMQALLLHQCYATIYRWLHPVEDDLTEHAAPQVVLYRGKNSEEDPSVTVVTTRPTEDSERLLFSSSKDAEVALSLSEVAWQGILQEQKRISCTIL